MRTLIDGTQIATPGAIGFGVITLTDAQAISAIAVALVTIVCTIAVTVHKWNKS